MYEALRGHQGEEQPADRCGRVDAPLQHDQVDAALLRLIDELEQVPHRTSEPVKADDDQLVTGA